MPLPAKHSTNTHRSITARLYAQGTSTPTAWPHSSPDTHYTHSRLSSQSQWLMGDLDILFKVPFLRSFFMFQIPNVLLLTSKPEAPSLCEAELSSGASLYFIPPPRVSSPAFTGHLAIQSFSQPTKPPSIHSLSMWPVIHPFMCLSTHPSICPSICCPGFAVSIILRATKSLTTNPCLWSCCSIFISYLCEWGRNATPGAGSLDHFLCPQRNSVANIHQRPPRITTFQNWEGLTSELLIHKLAPIHGD